MVQWDEGNRITGNDFVLIYNNVWLCLLPLLAQKSFKADEIDICWSLFWTV